jgi:hypothetical protein
MIRNRFPEAIRLKTKKMNREESELILSGDIITTDATDIVEGFMFPGGVYEMHKIYAGYTGVGTVFWFFSVWS